MNTSYSNSVRRFIEDNRPESVVWNETDLRTLAHSSGMLFVAAGEYHEARARLEYPENLAFIHAGGVEVFYFQGSVQSTVTWQGFVEDDGVAVTYKPSLPVTCSREVSAKLFAAAGIQPVKVIMPERVITVDAPAWVSAVGDGNSMLVSELDFESAIVRQTEAYFAQFNQVGLPVVVLSRTDLKVLIDLAYACFQMGVQTTTTEQEVVLRLTPLVKE